MFCVTGTCEKNVFHVIYIIINLDLSLIIKCSFRKVILTSYLNILKGTKILLVRQSKLFFIFAVDIIKNVHSYSFLTRKFFFYYPFSTKNPIIIKTTVFCVKSNRY